MDSAYDKKFAEMKQYIPFLENMIKKLEMSGNGPENPRHAQLSKIKALRDLLLDRSKRMKMENLLKCEQVLVNLYAKVEQRETLPGIQKASCRSERYKDTSKLESVRNKLKKVTMLSSSQDTLPEIDRANESEVVCSPGSKEPALFQRRPNKMPSPPKTLPKSSDRYSRSKYTRVLVSPEPDSSRWSHKSDDLYHRRSPRRYSPRRRSPNYKKDKKKKRDAEKSGKNKLTQSLNIMLNVPEDTIDSLNTSDICERIMNCEDTDVDIKTLRDLRSQIMSELKQTSVVDKNKVTEVEEGELSDSESEAIERIYGSLVLVSDDKNANVDSNNSNDSLSKNRKVQICLKFVPNTDKYTSKSNNIAIVENDIDGNTYSEINQSQQLDLNIDHVIDETSLKCVELDKKPASSFQENDEASKLEHQPTKIDDDKTNDDKTGITKNSKFFDSTSIDQDKMPKSHIPVCQPDFMQSGANFYKPIADVRSSVTNSNFDLRKDNSFKEASSTSIEQFQLNTQVDNKQQYTNKTQTAEYALKNNKQDSKDKKIQKLQSDNANQSSITQSEIPFLAETEMPISNKTPKNDVSEIDILQALKNEILNEKIDIPGPEIDTPALHQPKILKVTDAKELSAKKKISLEKYKEQSNRNAFRTRIYKYKAPMSISRGLTVKECERFNFPVEMALSDESPVEDDEPVNSVQDVYDDLIPKSPDHEINEAIKNSPIIIPVEPLNKVVIPAANTDVDMRVLSPLKSNSETMVRNELEAIRPKDPRLRKENMSVNQNATPRPLPVPFPNMTPSRTPMSMTFETSSSHTGFDFNVSSPNRRHIYAPLLSSNEHNEIDRNNHTDWDDKYRRGDSSVREINPNRDHYISERNNLVERKEDYYSRAECPRTPSNYFGRGDRADGSMTPVHPFGRSDRADGSMTPVHPFGRSDRSDGSMTPVHPFGRSDRSDGSMTPVHSFGRIDCPSTPSHPFGRNDRSTTPRPSYSREMPSTPVHPFGRSEIPTTPIHSFGRHETPSTPVHPFGRSDVPLTPVHPFGRNDVPSTPIHPFGRADVPTTPVHPFGRGDIPKTPVHPFGRDVSDSYRRNDSSSHKSDINSYASEKTYGSYENRSDLNSQYAQNNVRQSDSRNHSCDISREREKSVDRKQLYTNNQNVLHSRMHGSHDKDSYIRNNETEKYTTERSVGRISEKHDYSNYNPNIRRCSEIGSKYKGSNEKYDKPSHSREQSVGRNYDKERFSGYSSDNLVQHREKSVSRQYDRSSYEKSSHTRERSVGRIMEKNDFSNHDANMRRYSEIGPRYKNSYEKLHAPELSARRNYEKESFSTYSTLSNNTMRHRAKSVGREYNDTRSQPNEYSSQRSLTTNFHDNDQGFKRSRETKSFVRAQSVGRNYEKHTTENTVSVDSQAGRSFTIDTSVNSTFQVSLKSEGTVFNKLFDARRQRAASVGRSLTQERNIMHTSNREDYDQKFNLKGEGSCNRKEADFRISTYPFVSDRFNRAKSVGREIISSNKSFKDIKAEFESFRSKTSQKLEHKSQTNLNTHFVSNIRSESRVPYSTSFRCKSLAPDTYINSYKNERKNKDLHQGRQGNKTGKEAYSPRKNLRDPRFNRSHGNSNRRGNYVLPNERRKSDSRNYGIVYSDHNISSGKILGPGCAVKNYKIPKIKRPEPEITQVETDKQASPNKIAQVTDETKTEKSASSNATVQASPHTISEVTKQSTKVIKENKTEYSATDDERISTPKQSPDKKETDSPKMNKLSSIATRRRRKNVVYDSDSDKEDKSVECYNTVERSDVKNTLQCHETNEKKLSVTSSDIQPQNETDMTILSDIENEDDFSENITADDVLDNIDSIIANLDKDLGVKTDNQLSTDSLFDFIRDSPTSACSKVSSELENNIINTSQHDQNANSDQSNLLFPSEKYLQEDNDTALPKQKEVHAKVSVEIDEKQHEVSKQTQAQTEEILEENLKVLEVESNNLETLPVNQTNKNDVEATVSTSGANNYFSTKTDNTSIQITTTCSSPDSTINTEDTDAQNNLTGASDNILNIQNELSSDITSTSAQLKSDTPKIDKTELSGILNTIKDLLSKLDDPAEHEKIKIKLENLTKIVSTEDDRLSDTEKKDKITKQSESDTLEKQNKIIEKSNKLLKDGQNIPGVKNKDSNYKNNEEESLSNSPLPCTENFSETVVSSKISENNDSSKKNASPSKSESNDDEPIARKAVRKIKNKKKGVGKRGKKTAKSKQISSKRVTRSDAATKNQARQKGLRELQMLHEDLRDMFISKEVINSTGIRMCRLAKLDESVPKKINEVPKSSNKVVLSSNDTISSSKPLVVLEKIPAKELLDKPTKDKTSLIANQTDIITVEKEIIIPPAKYKPGPKSKKQTRPPTPSNFKFIEKDPFLFEYDSVSETTRASDSLANSSDSEKESLASSKSFNSSIEMEKQKPKRKRRSWQQGIIKTSKSKKKVTKTQNTVEEKQVLIAKDNIKSVPDRECFIDKNCCFSKDVLTYHCKLCQFEGEDIVKHYKICHPHYEIPMSRMSPKVASASIKQSYDTNFKAINKIPVTKYTCRFCFQTIVGEKDTSLENFFWHVVTTHTGEFKHFCSECQNEKPCPFMLDTPPPPKRNDNVLRGYVCERCYYTQVSLENIKNHVSLRHNDDETEVFAISLGVISPQTVKLFKTTKIPRTLRSRTSKQNYLENTDDTSDDDETLKTLKSRPPKILSRLSFENDVHDSIFNSPIKDEALDLDITVRQQELLNKEPQNGTSDLNHTEKEQNTTENLYVLAHFKISYTKAGIKEYVCCINGNDSHYKTSLLISMKKHVQTKHVEIWDGYCHFCKVIVMPQGKHNFKECLAHYLENHIDDIPEMESDLAPTIGTPMPEEMNASIRPVINVRPLSDLVSSPSEPSHSEDVYPKIHSAISLNTEITSNKDHQDQSESRTIKKLDETILFEEAQKEVMLKKHRVVLDNMLSHEKLAHIFKCAGRFCSFTCNLPEDALLHASTHLKLKDSDAIGCAYCSVDTSNNAIDLVSHVFKTHGSCQFSCSKCFYRAAAVQLVDFHYTKAHGDVTTGSVIKCPSATTPPDNEEHLSRNDAVPAYECCYDDGDKRCKYKTFAQEKFIEHFEKNHAGVQPRCQSCEFIASDVKSLIVHLASHGFRLYHCIWCGFGADNDDDIIAHSSARHPSRRPQAYLRQIRELQDGSLKQLLMVHVNKMSGFIPIEITQTKVVENPVKEAERSVELETLIGQTLQILETANNSQEPPAVEAGQNNDNRLLSDLLATPTRNDTPAPNKTQIEEQKTPVLKDIKRERQHKTQHNVSEVVCLDSDDEDTNIRDSFEFSDDSNIGIQAANTVHHFNLFKCGSCLQIYKSQQTFRIHFNSAHSDNSLAVLCFHCNYSTKVRKDIVKHYKEVHMPKDVYTCATCQVSENSLKNIKRHCLQSHGYKTLTENAERCADGSIKYIVGPANKRSAPKRKQSQTITSTRPSKIKRYSPDEVNLLPIQQILDEPVQCSICEYTTKVRSNIVRHLQGHAQHQPVPQIAPVNPVPHLESNEMHFDKMVNLASSSIQPNKPTQKPDNPTKVFEYLPAEKAARLPKYVPERQRFACGAKQCSYISIDENMLKFHWEALHDGTNDFKCVHCPPYQELDKSRPLTAARIIAHLKMHDIRLFSCSLCPYYHHHQYLIEKHINEKHEGNAEVRIVRNSTSAPQTSILNVSQNAAPTMDLKPWQCGLCDFKSMLRQEVVEHCSQRHSSKFQYRCGFCPMRSSTLENVTKHQATCKHASKGGSDVFYYYYREGSLPEDPDMPRWKKQRIMLKLPPEPEVKAETEDAASQPQLPITIDLNLVKKEVDETDGTNVSGADLCKQYGQFCDPIGCKYLCPLCKVTTEESKESMQAHLYEELKYRKWSCAVCSYKSYHKKGLKEHTFQEHRQNKEPLELASNIQLEKWIENLLSFQEKKIKERMQFLQKSNNDTQQLQGLSDVSKQSPSTSLSNTQTIQNQDSKVHASSKELEAAFGSFGSTDNSMFCCPKCDFSVQEEDKMYQHLESELAKIRWCCTNCPMNFHAYHMAQLHCKSVHPGQSARAIEAVRDPEIREQWIVAVIQSQKQNMSVQLVDNPMEEIPDTENSLLMVRYEENVPIPDLVPPQPSTSTEIGSRRSRNSSSSSTADGESDDEKLVIDECSSDAFEKPKKKPTNKKHCPYCDFETVYSNCLFEHTLRHYNLKPFKCAYCSYMSYLKSVEKHCANAHPDLPMKVTKVQMPNTLPTVIDLYSHQRPSKKRIAETVSETVKEKKQTPDLICLICGYNVEADQLNIHSHLGQERQIAQINNIVLKCGICGALRKTIIDIKAHHTEQHADLEINYAYHKLNTVITVVNCMVENCDKTCRLRDIDSHFNKIHPGVPIKYSLVFGTGNKKAAEPQDQNTGIKRPFDEASSMPPQKRIAKKSTTKLPNQESKLMFDFGANENADSATYTQDN